MSRAVLVTLPADLPAVEDTLRSLAPRWTMWIASTLTSTGRPMQRNDLEDALAFIPSTTMGLRLSRMRSQGLIERTGASQRAPMRLTERGEAISPLYAAVAAWAGKHLELGAVANAERVETALHRLALTDTLTVLRLVTANGQLRLADLAKALGHSDQLALTRVRRMQDDGLIEWTGRRDPYTLTAAARELAPVYTAAHQWASRCGKPQPSRQSAAALTSVVPAITRAGRTVPGLRFSDLGSAPAASYANGAGRTGVVRR